MDKVNIPAIRGKIGTFTYYITSFTFEQVANNVKRIDDELHSSTSLRDQIQRSLTDNSHKIKDYILSQNEHFFNSLVLAVYDGEPKWVEMEIDFQNSDFYNLGFLQFNGEEKIFPVDGQHRVEGIREALKEKPELADETIGIILIGHSKTPEGMEKSRRIFSTLNRYAKPVRLGDIIALDEDDIVAIVTRELLETYPLFMGSRIKVSNSKSIPNTDKESFTTLMTLYSCHLELLRAFLFQDTGKILTNTQIKEYLRFRPTDEIISNFTEYLQGFWNAFVQTFPEIDTYLQNESENAAAEMRSSVTGGNIFFRPIVLFPFIESIARIKISDHNNSFVDVLQRYSNLERTVSNEPWNKVIWNPITKKMIMRNQTLIKYIFLYLYDSALLLDKEKQDMKNKYATILNIEDVTSIINRLIL
jgi:DNA sulfur modification protein DndB